MEVLLIGLAVLAIALVAIPLVVLRIGIHRLHRAGSLTCQPPGLSAALTRRVLGLYAQMPTTDRCDHVHCAPPVFQDGKPWTS
jgi:hypothetical protein